MFLWEVVQSAFVYGLVTEYFAIKLCRAALKGFDDLTDKQKNAFKLEIIFFIYAIIFKCVGYYLILFDENVRQDNLWNSTLANWNYTMAIGGILADMMFRIIWKIKLYPALILHLIYVIGTVAAVFPIHKAILCIVSLKVMLFVPTPLVSLRYMVDHIRLKATMLEWKIKFLGFAADAILGLLFLPFYYIQAFYMAEEFWGPDSINNEHLCVGFLIGILIDLIFLLSFMDTCSFVFSEWKHKDKQTNKEIHKAPKLSGRRKRNKR
ncbi:uncharacterized protein LOC143470090 [Clavelina lepadiformis]|uniref:Uncharacterized protein n=1 Tax=Clavelina lepadiformis TaxID=159417 RepID=A0ABP0FHZ4_CLALP